MQRTSFDVNSIAALLRQTEANLAALKPRQEAQRYSGAGEQIFSSTLPFASSAPVRSQTLGAGVELETQVVQLRTCIETLERRLEDELRSFLAISDKRLQAREEQLRGIGETLQASADAAFEQLNRRVDTRLRDMERAGLAPSALDEIWEALKRLEADSQDLDGKLRRAASADELAERLKEVERAQVQRFDERLATQEKRMGDMRLQLQTANDEFLQAINRRCEVLEKIVWEGQSEKGNVETVFKRLAEAAPIREMQDEINACNYEKEVQRTRLTTLEAKLSKQAALESKVDFMESQTSQQLEEQAQKFRHVSELQLKLSQKLAATEAASQRVEAQGATLQAKLLSQLDEERDRMNKSFEALQQRVATQLDEVEGRASRGSKRSEQDVVDHMNALAQKVMEESVTVQKQAEKRLQSVDERCEQVIQAARGQMEKAIQDLKMSAEVAKNAMDVDLQRMDRFVQEIGSKMSSQEGQLLRLSDVDVQRSRIETVESKLNEVQGEQRQLRDLKAIVDAHKLQADRRLGDLYTSLASIEEQLRDKDRRRTNDADEQRALFEGLQNRLMELQVQVRQKSVENSDLSLASLEPLATVPAQKLVEEVDTQKMEKRLQSVDERCDQVIQAARSQMEKAIEALKMDAEVAKSVLDADLQRMDRFAQELGLKMSSQAEKSLRTVDEQCEQVIEAARGQMDKVIQDLKKDAEGARKELPMEPIAHGLKMPAEPIVQSLQLSDIDSQRSRIETVESKLNEFQGEQRQLRDLKAIVDAHKLQADRRLDGLSASVASIEEQLREKDKRQSDDTEERIGADACEEFDTVLSEQVQDSQKTFMEYSDLSVASLEPLSTTPAACAAAVAAVTQPKQPQTPTSQASQASSASQGLKVPEKPPRRQRVTGMPATAKASARSKDEDIQKVFSAIDTSNSGVLTLEALQSYLCDHLGFGQAEAAHFFKSFSQGDGISMDGFKKGYPRLTPFLLSKRQNEVLIRKSGSLSSMGPQSLQIEELNDCEVYICEVTNTIFVDECKRCPILIGPCETSVFVRDCEDCVFWIAAQQLRTRGCKRCKFFLYSKTEPVIEASQELAFAPWSASYPCAKAHFERFGFDPDVNLWNAIFDFSGKKGMSNWRILGLEEVNHIDIDLDDPPPKRSPENPARSITFEALCAAPLESGESTGQSVGAIPQTRPALPAAPPSNFKEVQQLHVQDGAKLSVFEQLQQPSQSVPKPDTKEAVAPPSSVAPPPAVAPPAAVAPPPAVTSESHHGGLEMAALAGKTFMEVAGGSIVQHPQDDEVDSDIEVSALGMASLAGQAFMEAGTTVVGTMDVDEEESSGDSPRIKQLAPPASTTAKPTLTPAEVKKQLQKQLGESSEEEEEVPKAVPKASQSMALPKAKIARQIGDSEDDEDSDIERAMKKAAAEAARARQAPGSSKTSAPAVHQAKIGGPAASDSDDNFFDDDEELPM